MQRLKLGINVGNIHIKARSRWRSPPKKNRSWNATSLDPIGTHDPTWKQNTSEWYRQRIRARPRNEAPAAGAEASVSTGDLNLPPNVTFYNKWRRRREREREAEFCQCDGHWEFIQIQRERERETKRQSSAALLRIYRNAVSGSSSFSMAEGSDVLTHGCHEEA